jgi:hypothetical protein
VSVVPYIKLTPCSRDVVEKLRVTELERVSCLL